MASDGGYFAIKGFDYQIDKAILELLSSDDDTTLYLERIQDIDTENLVIQVKHKEKAKFVPSIIKDPVIQLLQEYQRNSSKKYYLYASFDDLNSYETFVNCDKQIDVLKLDQILGNKKGNFSDMVKNGFVGQFVLDFAPTFQQQFDEVIKKMQESNLGKDFDETILYYYNLAMRLRQLITTNSDPKKRGYSRKQALDLIASGKIRIFNSAYREYKGDAAYLALIKKSFLKAKQDKENLLIFGNTIVSQSIPLGQLVVNITEKFYKLAKHNIKPLTIILPDSMVNDVKECLIVNKILFNDGYETIKFDEEIFLQKPIINKKVTRNNIATESLGKISFKIRILSFSNYKMISSAPHFPQMIYYFDSEIINHFEDIAHQKIDSLSTLQINSLFK